MYDFHDLNPTTRGEPVFVPAEALLIDGQPLETMVLGYRTLNVSGRELLPRTISTQEVTGSLAGSRYMTSNFDAREITIKYQLIAPDSFAYRQKFDELNAILSRPQMEISFADQPDYGWNVTLTGAEAPEVGSNSVTASYTLTAVNPFKHRLRAVVLRGNPLTVLDWTPVPTAPDYFEVTGVGLASTIDIKCGEYIITLNGDFKAGDVVRVQPSAEDKILLNGEPHPEMLALASDLENVVVQTGDVVTVEPGGQVAMAVRSKRA